MTAKADIVAKIKSQGERLTLPRQAVVETLCVLGGHQTMQAIQHYLMQEGVEMQESTVYRALQWLKDLGLVAQTDLGQSGITYELVTTPPHHHLVCLRCGRIQSIDDSAVEPLRHAIYRKYAFEARIDHMAFFGLCDECRSQENAE